MEAKLKDRIVVLDVSGIIKVNTLMIKSKLKYVSFTIACTLMLSASGVILQPSLPAFAANSSATTTNISDILKYQNADGGWVKGYNTAVGDWKHSTIDNGYTYLDTFILFNIYA